MASSRHNVLPRLAPLTKSNVGATSSGAVRRGGPRRGLRRFVRSQRNAVLELVNFWTTATPIRIVRPDSSAVPASCLASSNRYITSLPFNKVAWLTTHNSFAIVGAPELTGPRITFYNQEDSVTDQLNNGVRGLMLDMYDYKNDVWLCHSFDGECLDITSFAPALDTVKEIMTFLVNNPSEIVTLFIEDYVSAVNGISNVFRAAGINQYLFPLASMPAPGADWPTVGTMIQNNWRLVVFTSKSSKQATEGIAYQWNFVDENQYGDDGLVAGLCPNRAESQFMNSTRNSLILQNYFHTNPVQDTTCRDNSQALYDELTACYTASANRWANFLSVDFYKTRTAPGQCPSETSLSPATSPTADAQLPSPGGPAAESRADKAQPWVAFLTFSCWALIHLLLW
ncbi:hypothetical protein AXG93_3822s1280 [Marchantia polymorpha subsp. ruderalis]|uniref:Phosphatidylinositol-specific phospholipase C X domain-containing protein n=1 Tax=Marchantia polymorpha subsp. ruderalis TaxID=1480154 RepID=A0A176WMG9_MARPO|nr:hypothetical protein AXG93_3822s1280 [Marchantia polymorpha subsp. ruderalis]